MERLQGPINPYFLENQPRMEGLEVQRFVNFERLGLEEEEEEEDGVVHELSLEDKMPFLQMLQGGDSQPFSSFKDANFLALLSLQHLKTPWELESYGTHIQFPSEFKTQKNPISNPCMDGVSSEANQHGMRFRDAKAGSSSSPQCSSKPRIKRKETHLNQTVIKERRKRKRMKAVKNTEEVENQRMTHIAVERNRRRQMNEHLNSLRFLMPPSYIQRGDQASIIGGAIDFVKELEQFLQSLVAQKRRKQSISEEESTENSSARDSLLEILSNAFCASSGHNEEDKTIPRIEATVIQNHVNLKVECRKKHGRLLNAIVLLEELRLTVLHLNVASSDASFFFSFNLKMEDDCQMKLADEIAAAAHQIFSQIDG